MPSVLPCVVDSGKEHDGVPQLNQFGPCLWWTGAEKVDGKGWEERSGNWVGQVDVGGHLGKRKFLK